MNVANSESERDLGRPSYVLVVGLQFDPIGEAVWQEVLRLTGRAESAAIHLCHVVDTGERRGVAKESARVRAGILDDCADTLQVFCLNKAGTLAGQPTKRIRLHVSIGNVAKRLVDYAAETTADAIVIGAHAEQGRAGIEHGRVASELIRITPCSLIIVRAKDYASRPAAAVAVESDPFPTQADTEEEVESRRSFPFGLDPAQMRRKD